MLKSVFRFALPGGRRVFVVYVPPEREKPVDARPHKIAEPPVFDRIFAQAGLHFRVADQNNTARPRRGR